MSLGLVTGCTAAAGSSDTVLADIAGVFDEQLAGFQAGYTPTFAGHLAAARPGARQNGGWPEADYALFEYPGTYDSDAKAVGIVVWVGAPGTETQTLCAEVGVDRAGARIQLQERNCPDQVPSEPGQTGAPGDAAAVLELAMKIHSALVTGQPANRGMTMAGVLPSHPKPAAGPCSAKDLSAIFDSGNAAGNTDNYLLRVQNISQDPCELSAATGIDITSDLETLGLPWIQNPSAVTLQPWESAVTAVSYRPHQMPSVPQRITLRLQDGDVRVGASAGPGGMLNVAESTEISATPWQVVGYGVAADNWENGYPAVDVAPPCPARQLAVTTPSLKEPSSGREEPEELPYWLLNIGTGTCRIDRGTLTGLASVPPLQVAFTVVLQPGTAVALDVDGGAPDLSGTVVIDGVSIGTVGGALSAYSSGGH